jgi:F0F1-type ATP synthase assembly protein I
MTNSEILFGVVGIGVGIIVGIVAAFAIIVRSGRQIVKQA